MTPTDRDPDLCQIPHCPYVPHEAGLCRRHWAQVPIEDRRLVDRLASAGANYAASHARQLIRRKAVETLT